MDGSGSRGASASKTLRIKDLDEQIERQIKIQVNPFVLYPSLSVSRR